MENILIYNYLLLIDMKALTIAYGGLLLLLIIVSLIATYIVGGPETIQRNVVSVEGKLIYFTNEANILKKTLNQSIDFISQRAAYDIGLNGGTNNPSALWSYDYPDMATLENELEKNIMKNLPSKKIEDNNFEISWIGNRVVVSDYYGAACGSNQNSKCFLVSGENNFSVYDTNTQSRIDFKPFNISSYIISSYFKLLYVGRKILTDPRYNSVLDDKTSLKNLLEADFPDLDFTIADVSTGIIEITIEDNTCLTYNEYYCIAPLKQGETGIVDPVSGGQIPYDYLKLKFRVSTT